MLKKLPLENLNNAFDKQFLAMRYLLLGLLEDKPQYVRALHSLEAATPYVEAFNANGWVDTYYQAALVSAFDLYSNSDAAVDLTDDLVRLLTPNFSQFPVVQVDPAADEDEGDSMMPQLVGLPAMVSGNFDKLFVSMQFYLLGLARHDPSYLVAYDALMYTSKIHTGFRKNGKTPEFQHQLEIAHLMRTLKRYMMYPAETLAAIFLHDTPEDYDVERAELEKRFGPRVAHSAMLLNKYDEQGNAKPLDEYYSALAYDPIASIAKPGDNAHNQSTMPGVFGFKKQHDYTQNIRMRSWSMMKVARRLHPLQEPIYQNLGFILRTQYNGVQAMLDALKFDPDTGRIHPALEA